MRILVTGSRDYGWWNTVNEALLEVCADATDIEIMHGACPTGADMHAHRFAEYQGVRELPVPANWDTHGKKAGPLRNQRMVNAGADICLVFAKACSKPEHRDQPEHMSHGTADCMRRAEKAGIPIRQWLGNREVTE